MINILQNLEYLHQEAKKFASKAYQEALDKSFEYFWDMEYSDGDDLNEARAEFEKSNYYFLTLKDFEKYKSETLQEFKNDAQKQLIKLIYQANNIDDLREAKKIYDSIVKIVDSNQIKFYTDCKIVLFN